MVGEPLADEGEAREEEPVEFRDGDFERWAFVRRIISRIEIEDGEQLSAWTERLGYRLHVSGTL